MLITENWRFKVRKSWIWDLNWMSSELYFEMINWLFYTLVWYRLFWYTYDEDDKDEIYSWEVNTMEHKIIISSCWQCAMMRYSRRGQREEASLAILQSGSGRAIGKPRATNAATPLSFCNRKAHISQLISPHAWFPVAAAKPPTDSHQRAPSNHPASLPFQEQIALRNRTAGASYENIWNIFNLPSCDNVAPSVNLFYHPALLLTLATKSLTSFPVCHFYTC